MCCRATRFVYWTQAQYEPNDHSLAAWETSIALQPSEKIIAEKKKKEKEAKDSLRMDQRSKINLYLNHSVDSPYVWVGIALVGLIAVAALLLAIVSEKIDL